MSVTRKSYAKVNLHLTVLNRRPDGFHNVKTIMQRVSLHDRVNLSEADEDRFRVSGNHAVPADHKNIAREAIAEFREETGLQKPVDVHLEKFIPPGSGLGGGSSNAATVLEMLNNFLNDPLSREQLEEIGARLGSDVNFFLNGPTGLCTGRGEQVQEINFPLTMYFLLALPDVSCDTSEVYGNTEKFLNQPEKRDILNVVDELKRGNWPGGLLQNDLQLPAEDLYPTLKEIRKILENNTQLPILMSGSGSTFFIGHPERPKLETVKKKCKKAFRKNNRPEVDLRIERSM